MTARRTPTIPLRRTDLWPRRSGPALYHSASRSEAGVILIFWTLSLTVLALLLAATITLGNLVQSGIDLQGAADAVALAGAGGINISDLTPGSQGETMLAAYGLNGNWAQANPITECPAQPSGLSLATAQVNGDGVGVEVCTSAPGNPVIWVFIRAPEPSLAGTATVGRSAVAYVSSDGPALCDASTNPSTCSA